MILLQVAAVPDQVRQFMREIDGMLTGTAANLQDLPAVGKQYLDNLKNRLPVVIAGGGIWFDHYLYFLY